jgi:aminopeptidase
VFVLTFDVEQALIARAVTEVAYADGARYVSVVYWDQHVKRSRLAHAPADTLGFVPGWFDSLVAECVERRSAVISAWGDPHRALLVDIPSERVAMDHMPFTPSMFQAVSQGEIALTVIPGPCPGVAEAMLSTPDVDRLWQLLAAILRLDAAEPEQARREHIERLQGRVAAPGAAQLLRAAFPGRRHRPDRRSAQAGALDDCRAPDQLGQPDGREHAHRGGVHYPRPSANRGNRPDHATDQPHRRWPGRGPDGPLRAQMATDPGAARLGEVALVDGSSPVGQTGIVFGDILIDENATSHIAWGSAYAFTAPDLPEDEDAQVALGFNHSDIHQDAMIGGPQVDVLGIGEDRGQTSVISADTWVLS